MALFFDKPWFAAALADRGLDWAHLAGAAGLSGEEIERIVKDEREVSPREVTAFAALLGAPPEEIARRCGVSTRAPQPDPLAARLDRIEAKIDRLIALMASRDGGRD